MFADLILFGFSVAMLVMVIGFFCIWHLINKISKHAEIIDQANKEVVRQLKIQNNLIARTVPPSKQETTI